MLIPMSNEMRERVNQVIRSRTVTAEVTADHRDQAPINDWLGTKGATISAAYTPWGVACIEAAFLDRMQIPDTWDSKDRIRRDILSNPHLHLNLKDRLLQAFERADWQKWYDSWFAKRIMALEPGEATEGLRAMIEQSPYLASEMRDNLLLNLKLIQQEV